MSTVVYSIRYYPYGEAIDVFDASVLANTATTADRAQPYLYGGKELERMHGLGEYDYGARRLQSHLPLWTTQDPCLEKYYSTSPYTYCAANPIRFTDPTGCIFEDKKEKKDLINGVNKKIETLKKDNEKKQEKIDEKRKKGKETDKEEKQISENNERINELQNTLQDIQKLDDDPDHSYTFYNNSETGGAYSEDGKKVVILANNVALQIHEIRHIADYLNLNGLKFDAKGKMITDYVKSNNKVEEYQNVVNNELSAYRAQYAYDPKSLPTSYQSSVSRLSDINLKWLTGIYNNGQAVYRFAIELYKFQKINDLK